jgi:hypothetical protein
MDGRVSITAKEDCARLDVFLARELNATRSRVKRLIDGGCVRLNAETVKGGKAVKTGDAAEVDFPPAPDTDILPEDIPVDVLYEDADIAVINKPQGIADLVRRMVVGKQDGLETGRQGLLGDKSAVLEIHFYHGRHTMQFRGPRDILKVILINRRVFR